MKSRMSKAILHIFVMMLLITSIAAVFTGCGAKKEEEEEGPRIFIEVTDDGLVSHFYGKSKGVAGGSGITIEEGQYLSIDNRLTEGRVHVTVTAGGDDVNTVPTESDKPAAVDYTFDKKGGVTDYHEINPGSYMVNFSVEENAVGDIYASVKTAE